MSTDQPPPGVSAEEFAAYVARQTQHDNSRTARRGDGIEFSELVAQLATLPPETDDERAVREKRLAEQERTERLSRFRRVCPPEFMQKIDRTLLTNTEAFDSVAQWDGRFPGPLAVGKTDTAKTRAAWSALCRLNVNEKKSFAWFPVKRLLTEFVRYESKDLADEFWRYYRGFNVLFVDDVDKINWAFESETTALFQFYDWVYRDNRPVITTTNRDRQWWEQALGPAFARRLFDDAHRTVTF